MLIINTSTTPTSNVYNSLPTIYNLENTGSGNIRQSGAFMNYGGTATLADTAFIDLYDSNSMPFGHYTSVMTSDQAAYTMILVNWRYRNSNMDYGFYISTNIMTSVGCSLSVSTNTALAKQYVRLTNSSGASRTFYWSVLSLTG